jgi:ATP-dependent DNA helicase DinG
MGQVVAFAPASTPADYIDTAYERLAAQPGFRVRAEQKRLSRAIFEAFVAGTPLVAEAPTGVGKTLAYLVGALAASQTTSQRPATVVISTATVGLQAQILANDLPRLVKAGLLEEGDAVIAKGRGRYLCVNSAERLAGNAAPRPQYELFDATANANADDSADLAHMLELFHGRAWDGELDSYPGRVPRNWSDAAASADTCISRRCQWYDDCPFFEARKKLSFARVIVANHDLVLSDLAMAADGAEPLFPGASYLVVFDEAHHVPDKALETGSTHLDLEQARIKLTGAGLFSGLLLRHPSFVKALRRKGLEEADFDHRPLLGALDNLYDVAAAVPLEQDQTLLRFPGGEVPCELRQAARFALEKSAALSKAFGEAAAMLRSSRAGDDDARMKGAIAETLYHGAFFSALLKKTTKALLSFSAAGDAVRWMERRDSALTLNTCPLEGADVLKRLAWGHGRASPVFVSATLRDFDGYERFLTRAGLPPDTRTLTLPPIFAYQENTLWLVDTKHSPRHDEREQFAAELRALVPGVINPAEGTLILFPSQRMMDAVMPAVRACFPGQVRTQGDGPLKDLLARHRQDIDRGKGAILAGLATLAEGLDLPGAYCTHVIICALPFTVPTTPLEAEHAERLGEEYFRKRALPDCHVKLVQMVGRLLRRESDRGTVTVFDKRLLVTRWGASLRNALPPFRMRRRWHRDITAAGPAGEPPAAKRDE